jgi:type I restriction enzyme S subunit
LWVKDFKANDPKFISYLLRTVAMDGSTASAVPGVNRNHLHRVLVGRPTLGTQRRVASILSAFDELIEINERRIELLEDLARSLYREWFVHFRFPGHEDAEFVDSELGPIPRGWRTSFLGDVVELKYGKSLTAKTRRDGPVAVVSSAGIVGEHDEALCAGPGIVVGRKGNVGSVWWIDSDFFPIDTTYYVVTDEPLGLIYWRLRDLEIIDSHAAVPGLSRDQANRIPVVVPDATLATTFAAIHDQAYEAIASHQAQLRCLAATRDLLLPRLVTGRLDVSDIDLGDLLPAEAA